MWLWKFRKIKGLILIWWNDLIWTWLDELQDATWEKFKKLLDNSWQCEKQIIFCFIYLLLSVPGLDTVPLQFSSHVDHIVPGSAQPHKPLGRTRSEPLPQSQRALHTHLLQQQHSAQLLERLKQQTHLGKVSASKCTLLSMLTERTKWARFREPGQHTDMQIWPVYLLRTHSETQILSLKCFGIFHGREIFWEISAHLKSD